MMARWDLRPLAADLSRLLTPLTLIVGVNDKAVPPRDAQRVRALIPATTPCTLAHVTGGGHLVHEEQPVEVARQIVSALHLEQDNFAQPVTVHTA